MNETYRKISVIYEIERAIKFLRIGLAEVQKISPANDFYDPALLYLSNGLERLFKTMLVLNFKETNDGLPVVNEIWNNKNGHDLIKLKRKVENICAPITRPVASMDLEIITNDSFINSICKVLSEYGKRSRYFNLDAILGVAQEFDSKEEWENLETQICNEIYGEDTFLQMLSDPKQLSKIYIDSNKEIIIILERFFRALTRQFVFGNFSSDSKTYYSSISDFSTIEDSILGKTDYGAFENHGPIKR